MGVASSCAVIKRCSSDSTAAAVQSPRRAMLPGATISYLHIQVDTGAHVRSFSVSGAIAAIDVMRWALRSPARVELNAWCDMRFYVPFRCGAFACFIRVAGDASTALVSCKYFTDMPVDACVIGKGMPCCRLRRTDWAIPYHSPSLESSLHSCGILEKCESSYETYRCFDGVFHCRVTHESALRAFTVVA